MEQKILEMLEMQRSIQRKNSQIKDIPSCINDDFCVATPKNMNNGILTMAFVDMQPLENVYPSETAFTCGTLFPNINKPFFGGRE